MICWEYDCALDVESLTELGLKGWEAYAVTVEEVPEIKHQQAYQKYTHHLKRQIGSVTEKKL